MRQISKNRGDIQSFNAWAKSEKLLKWEDFVNRFHPVYEKVRAHIAENEQDLISAYTEKPLGRSIHIDHFRKRSLYPSLTFDYANFLVDDRDDNYGACYKDKQSAIDTATFDGIDRIFCPVTDNMSDYVEFMFDGTMIPKRGLSPTDYGRVNRTIRVFNLNHITLKDKRAEIIKFIDDFRDGGLTTSEIIGCIEPSGFPTVVNWALGRK